jgi:hypothetical protein
VPLRPDAGAAGGEGRFAGLPDAGRETTEDVQRAAAPAAQRPGGLAR